MLHPTAAASRSPEILPRRHAMSLINRLQRRFGWLAIPNVTLALVIGQAVLWVASQLPQGISIERIDLNPALVLQGQVWRLATFLVTPPATRSVLVIFYFALLHTFGSTLEREWGAFKLNLFLLIGYVASVAAAFAAYAILGQQLRDFADPALALASITASNQFLYGSLFLAFARLYPDFIINLFFVLPIRIKWLALLAWIMYGYSFLRGDWMAKMLVIATVANYLIFFGPEHWRELRQGQRRRSFQTQAKRATAPATHVCVVCGLTSAESPRTSFRYCSKCSGQRCYCPEHIRDHEHVIDKEPVA